jgi:MFS family permease
LLSSVAIQAPNPHHLFSSVPHLFDPSNEAGPVCFFSRHPFLPKPRAGIQDCAGFFFQKSDDMNRFSVLNPSVHYSHFDVFTLSDADRNLLANTRTPGDTDFLQRPTPSRLRHSAYPTDFIADLYRDSFIAPSTTGTVQSDKNTPPPFEPGLRFYLAFSALAALSLVIALDGTSISVALPIIADELNGTAMEAFWSGTSFLLSCTVFQPVYATFSHIFGRKALTLFAVTLFLMGTIISGLSHNMTLMLIGRTVQGAGGSGIIALTNVLITDLVPLRNRGNWVGVLGAVWALGSVSGPIVGGAFAAPSLWRWIFWINVPFIAVSIAMVYFFIRLRTPASPLMQKLKQADWIGAFMFVGSMTSILIPLSWAGVQYDWGNWKVTVPLGSGIIGLVLTGFYESYVPAQPVLRFVVFSNRTTNLAYITTALHGMILWTLLYYQPLYFEGVRGFSPILAGVALFPATFTVAPMAIVTGVAISKTGKFRWAVWGGWGLTTLGCAFLCAIDSETQLTQVVLTDLIIGVGLGM